MKSDRWARIEALFQEALQRPPHERSAFLQEVCGQDEELRAEVESLLASHEQAEDFLAEPVLAPTEALARSEPVESLAGRRIGPYQVLEEIGYGGMGTVYLAERVDDEYRQRVALKIIKPGMDSRAIVRRFRNERQILATLDHPNIAKLLDGGTTVEGRPYFVMDYIEGLPIDQYCDTHSLSITQRLELFRVVCAAVHYAHQNLVVHRDLKPDNILVTADGTPKLMDFGIAKLLHPEGAGQTQVSTVAVRPMTPEYASPEQVRGEKITTGSDVYSLGVLLYELLTGQSPYQVSQQMSQEIERVICETEPERPSVRVRRSEAGLRSSGAAPDRPTASVIRPARGDDPERRSRRLRGDLDNIVLMALRKEPARRYASVREFSEDLRRYLDGLPVIARKDTLAYHSTKFIQRHKAGVLAATLIMVLLLVGMATTLWQARRAEQQEKRNRRLLYVAQMNLAYQDWEQGNLGRLQTLLENQRPQPGQEDLRGFEWHYLWWLSCAHTERFSLQLQYDGPIRSVAFSADGRRLAVSGGEGVVKIWDVAARQEIAILKGHTHMVWSLAFSPDGRRLATGSTDYTAKLWDVTARQEIATLKGNANEVFSVAFSPDGQQLATGSSDRTVKLWDVATGQEVATLKGHAREVLSVAFSPDGQRLATGGFDGTMKLWDVATKQEVATLKGHIHTLFSVVFAPDGQRLATAGDTVRLWEADTKPK